MMLVEIAQLTVVRRFGNVDIKSNCQVVSAGRKRLLAGKHPATASAKKMLKFHRWAGPFRVLHVPLTAKVARCWFVKLRRVSWTQSSCCTKSRLEHRSESNYADALSNIGPAAVFCLTVSFTHTGQHGLQLQASSDTQSLEQLLDQKALQYTTARALDLYAPFPILINQALIRG